MFSAPATSPTLDANSMGWLGSSGWWVISTHRPTCPPTGLWRSHPACS